MVSEKELELARMRAAIERGEVFEGASEVLAESYGTEKPSPRQRPTGESVMPLGWLGIGTGLLLAVYGAADDATWAMLLGGAIANLGTIALVAGYIVNAISYLPGRRK